MEKMHTAEPWKVSGTENIVAGGNYVVALDCRPEDALRIVACVNACAGISTENLEENLPVKELASRYNVAIRQRDELLAAASAVVERWDSPLWKDLPHTGEYIHRLREAIARVKGGAE